TAVDVGAWYGPWSFWLARRVEQVHCFEPNPRLAAALRGSVASNVTVHECAVSDREGTADLVLQDLSIGAEGTASIVPGVTGVGSHRVQTRRLDDCGLTEVRFIKIDVEGHERAAIEGARLTIERDRPVLFVELEDRMSDMGVTIGLLETMGYEGRFAMGGRWISTNEVDLAAWQREFLRSHPTQSYLQSVVRPNGYVNDVAFVHPESTWAPWD
ncbi:MAG: FkbM family methyltransferase, partial [Acidimicrobiia bacterium]